MGVADLNYKMSSKTRKEKREAFEAYINEGDGGYKAPDKASNYAPPLLKPT